MNHQYRNQMMINWKLYRKRKELLWWKNNYVVQPEEHYCRYPYVYGISNDKTNDCFSIASTKTSEGIIKQWWSLILLTIVTFFFGGGLETVEKKC